MIMAIFKDEFLRLGLSVLGDNFQLETETSDLGDDDDQQFDQERTHGQGDPRVGSLSR